METWEISIDFEEFDGPPIPENHAFQCPTEVAGKKHQWILNGYPLDFFYIAKPCPMKIVDLC